ncbi:4-carboxymuconolactone decarboxylase [Trinickia symbiotica]|uniref:Carboxymuconolactone decarboxylase family protein n=1 Tax=Trinickia symbiotica TaxID=863227 RepID=A0A2N7X6V6_9BURK|nr:carboxymuconolactone decarboxylase family protein [Trinickia symbiotica]PMS37205.1 carboxymuconolactone decarboxylase family protein [Trinickia symbiotica]PPK42726.1 4-carboxymuconolactone decarboxylase [Trinickia symbiotica]
MEQGKESGLSAGQRELNEIYHPAHAAWLMELKEFCPSYFSIIEEFGLGDLWQRPGLTARDKELVVFSTLITQGDTEIQLRQHVHTALKRGMTLEEILECIVLLAVYVGVPRTLSAIQTVRSELAEVA